MTELFNANLNIISQRWPIIASALQHASFEHLDAALVTGQNQTISVNGIQLSSRHNRMAEARLFIEQLPNDCKQVTVYGIGMGDVPSLLIDNPQLQQILICPLNIALFALLLSYTDQSEWLNDKRVVLVHQLELNRLATHYIAITPDLLLVENKNARIRDLIVFNKNKDYVNRPHSKDNPEMKKRMINNIEFIKQDPDAELLKKQYNVEEALVIGSGPSLEKHYNYLKKKSQLLPPEKPLIISVDTALMPLLEQEIVPDIVVSIDPNISKFHFPKVIPKELNL
ncbi:6-hydroxymethylpterin diphosphokinase MptE-like protein, partial [Shewanella sp.]|uniref:6-hydroxymethylpterin diphosphokinase MptE-like protein n=1 Tax=Shewanella sp. TaxID=50422 RepID=UPI003D1463BD